MDKLPITARIDFVLKEKGITKTKFYHDCEITSAAYSLWNKGKTVPSMKNIARIAQYLDVPISFILDGKEKPATGDGSGLSEDAQEAIKIIQNMDPEKLARKMAAIRAVLDME